MIMIKYEIYMNELQYYNRKSWCNEVQVNKCYKFIQIHELNDLGLVSLFAIKLQIEVKQWFKWTLSYKEMFRCSGHFLKRPWIGSNGIAIESSYRLKMIFAEW